jgi:hypothetical protein
MRDSTIFYRSFYEAISELTNEQQGIVYNAIFNYALNGIEPELTGIAKTVFTLIKPQLDANNKRFENGSKGGRPKQTETKIKPNNNQNKTKTEPNNNNNVNNNVNVNVNEKENKFSFRSALLSLGVDSVLVDEWLKVRKAKKAVNTETAFKALVREIEKSKLTANECIKISVEKSWSGFNSEWVDNGMKHKKQVGHEASRIDFTDNTL